MKYAKYKTIYDTLELGVFTSLVSEITKSKKVSKHTGTPCIEVNVFDYVELVYINERLTFLDSNGQHYYTYAECTLEDLIDILTKIE